MIWYVTFQDFDYIDDTNDENEDEAGDGKFVIIEIWDNPWYFASPIAEVASEDATEDMTSDMSWSIFHWLSPPPLAVCTA